MRASTLDKGINASSRHILTPIQFTGNKGASN
jgi:hypothetical protein